MTQDKMHAQWPKILLGVFSLLASFYPCAAEEQTSETPGLLHISLSSSSRNQPQVFCNVENGKHVYCIDIDSTMIAEPAQAAAINIPVSGWRDSKLVFDWQPMNAKATSEPEIRVQYERSKDLVRYFETVPKSNYSCLQLNHGVRKIIYNLAEKKSYFPLRVSIVGRADDEMGAHFKIANLEAGGLAGGKALPWTIGPHDPILTTHTGIWDSRKAQRK